MKPQGRFKYYGTRNRQASAQTSRQTEVIPAESAINENRWKIGAVLCAIGVVLFALFPLAKDSDWYAEHWILHSFWYSLVSVTLMGVGLFQFTKELTSYSKSTVRIAENVIMLVTVFSVLIMWFVFAKISSERNSELLEELGVATSGYVTGKSEENIKGEVYYKIDYFFYTEKQQQMSGTATVDIVTYTNYSTRDIIGIRYLPSKPEVHHTYFSDGVGNNINTFPSRDFTIDDIFRLGDFITDTSGLTNYVRSIEFGFTVPKQIDSVTVVLTNKHLYQRIIVCQNRYVEYCGMFDGSHPTSGIKKNSNYNEVEIDTLAGDWGYKRDQYVLAIKNLNESNTLFYHYRVYMNDSLLDTNFIPATFRALEGAQEYILQGIQ